MSVRRDFDDIARAWLELMPDEAPNHVITDVLAAIATEPQVRRRPWLTWRHSHMKSSLVALGAAAVVVVAGVIAVARSNDRSLVGATPTPPASAAPATTAPSAAASGATAVPASIQHVWLGDHDGLLAAGTGAALVVGPDSLLIAPANNVRTPVLTAGISAPTAGQIHVAGSGSQARCDAGQVGTYGWTLSSSGRSLTIELVSDPCAARAAALATTWTLVACQQPTDNCLGPLDAGTHVTQFVNFQHPTAGWAPNIGAISYTVPDGWANSGDWPDHFELTPMTSFAGTSTPAGPDQFIDITADVRAEAVGAPCSGTAATTGSSPAQIIAAIRNLPGLVVGAAHPITIDGKAGQMVDLTIDPAKLRPCGADRVVEFLVGPTVNNGLQDGWSDRLILLPLGASTIAIEMAGPTSSFSTYLDAATPIVTSLRLH